MKKRLPFLVVGIAGLAIGLAVAFGVQRFLAPPVSETQSRFERGRQVADRTGCFLCHGAEGRVGTTNFLPDIDEVPAWSPGNFAIYVKSVDEVREWIADGAPKRMLSDPAERDRIAKQLVKMPAYRAHLTANELEDLVFYVTAAGLLLPQDENTPEGRGRAVLVRLGCASCHGPEGRARPKNIGALKGYIPSWDSSDWDELVKDPQELREWVLDGAPKRLRSNPAANFFLTSQLVKMPAYRGHLDDQELEDLVAYVQFVRTRK